MRALKTNKALPKEEILRLESQTLTVSLGAVILLAVGSLAYGWYIGSKVVILNGAFSLVSLIGSGLNLLGARLVNNPDDRRFQFGYWHLEPMIHSFNAFIMLGICVYSFVEGLQSLRAGGNPVEATEIIGFSLVASLLSGGVWLFAFRRGRKIGSQFVQNDAREWLLDFVMGLITLIGFAALFFLEDPYRRVWQQYADSAMVAGISLILVHVPLKVLVQNLPEVLMITTSEQKLAGLVEKEIVAAKLEYHILDHSTHVLKVGRTYFIDINILAADDFQLQTIKEQDLLRERLWKATKTPLDKLWLTLSITSDPRWL